MIDEPEPRRDMSSEERPDATAAADAWNERYARTRQVWNGEPNATLVAELEGVAPGRALDVGCGEGADAIWLAGQGWQVSALDVSEVALDREVRRRPVRRR